MGAPLPGFHLTKKRAVAAEWVVSPVLEQAHCFRADLPLGGVGPSPPHIHVLAHFIDDGGRIVLLFLGGEALPLVEHYLACCQACFCFFRFFGFGIGVMNSARRRRSKTC